MLRQYCAFRTISTGLSVAGTRADLKLQQRRDLFLLPPNVLDQLFVALRPEYALRPAHSPRQYHMRARRSRMRRRKRADAGQPTQPSQYQRRGRVSVGWTHGKIRTACSACVACVHWQIRIGYSVCVGCAKAGTARVQRVRRACA
eukprot:1452214-Rhodomonas_salina.2